MKRYITVLALLLAIALTACQNDNWNDDFHNWEGELSYSDDNDLRYEPDYDNAYRQWRDVRRSQEGLQLEQLYTDQFGRLPQLTEGLNRGISYEEMRKAIETAVDEGYEDAVLQALNVPAHGWVWLNTKRLPELEAEYRAAFPHTVARGLTLRDLLQPAMTPGMNVPMPAITMDELEDIVMRSIEDGVNYVPDAVSATIPN